MNISDPFHNSIYTLKSNNNLPKLDNNSKKMSLILLGEIKEEYLQLNQVLYKCFLSEASLLDELTPS